MKDGVFEELGSSFRDPEAKVFRWKGSIYRGLAASYLPHYNRLMQSGCYDDLVERNWLIPHEEVPPDQVGLGKWALLLRPKKIPFISYPYEWCFGQLRDAAHVTLRIQEVAIEYGLSLKDSSAFNVQFLDGNPVFIDTSSFEILPAGKPWSAYRQFCSHFLGPLIWGSYLGFPVQLFLRNHFDGLPLDLVSASLPWYSWLDPSVLIHIHLHALSQRWNSSPERFSEVAGRPYSMNAFRGQLSHLLGLLCGLKKPSGKTVWDTYYDKTNYSKSSFECKIQIVQELLNEIQPSSVWDFGANLGSFSKRAAGLGASVVAFDSDPQAVEKAYEGIKKENGKRILPLLMDLSNPSPSLGWAESERFSLSERGPVDAVLALALVHHLAIGNNVPLERIAQWFHKLGKWLIIEFVPKNDSQVKKMLASRKDVFPLYHDAQFEMAFRKYYHLKRRIPIRDSLRTVFLMEAK